MRAAVAWAMLLTLLLKPRRGAVVKWVVRRCYEDRGWLRAMAERAAMTPAPSSHVWNPGVFDLEDLLYAALGTDTLLIDYVMDAVDVRGEERLLRERLVGPGDASKTDWLLAELEHTEALLSQWARHAPDADEEPYLALPSDLDTYVPTTCRGWLARSMAGYISASNELVGGGFFLRTDLDPTRFQTHQSKNCILVFWTPPSKGRHHQG